VILWATVTPDDVRVDVIASYNVPDRDSVNRPRGGKDSLRSDLVDKVRLVLDPESVVLTPCGKIEISLFDRRVVVGISNQTVVNE